MTDDVPRPTHDAPDLHAPPDRRLHPIVRLDYPIRVVGNLTVIAMVFAVARERPEVVTPRPIVALATVIAIGWPQLAYALAKYSDDSRATEYRNLLVDAFLVGAWVALMSFALWPSATMLVALCLAFISLGGIRFALTTIPALVAGMLVMVLTLGFHFHPATGALSTNLSILSLFAFATAFAYSSHVTAKKLVGTRKQLEESKLQLEDTSRMLEMAKATAEQARHVAESASRAKSLFLANMSHEFRTPLNAIIGYSEMLVEEAEDSGSVGLVPDLQKIRTAGKHLLGLIDSVLDLSKIEAGKVELLLDDFDITTLVQEVAVTAEPLVARNGNTFNLDCPRDIGSMYGDETKVRQVLINLVANAAKFTERGTVGLRVSRRLGPDGDWVTFVVTDTGIGISSDSQARLFQAFSQSDATMSRRYGGTGLGLAITRSYCRMHGGDVTVDSEKGRGSAFTVRLPARAGDPRRTGGFKVDSILRAAEAIRSGASQ